MEFYISNCVVVVSWPCANIQNENLLFSSVYSSTSEWQGENKTLLMDLKETLQWHQYSKAFLRNELLGQHLQPPVSAGMVPQASTRICGYPGVLFHRCSWALSGWILNMRALLVHVRTFTVVTLSCVVCGHLARPQVPSALKGVLSSIQLCLIPAAGQHPRATLPPPPVTRDGTGQ